jgi:spore germination protein YaaH
MKKFFYRVVDGDTALGVAKRFSVPVTALINLNNLKREIAEGDLLYIESQERTLYQVKPFETAESLGKKFNLSPEKILTDNGVPYLFYGLVITL